MLKKSREREREKFSGSLGDLCLSENVCNEEEYEEYDKEKTGKRDITRIRLTIFTGKVVAEAIEIEKDREREREEEEKEEEKRIRDESERFSNSCLISVICKCYLRDLLGYSARVCKVHTYANTRDHPRNSDSSKFQGTTKSERKI